MRVCILVPDLSPSGGISVVLSHARGLREAGHDVELVTTGARPPEAPAGLAVTALDQAAGRAYDWGIATWWETAFALQQVEARRRLVLLQSFEQRFYAEDDPFTRLGAAAVLALPADFVVVSPWMADTLAELRPDARCEVVLNGVDKTVFGYARREPRDGPLRILVEGQPTLWIKRIDRAIDACRAMSEPAELTFVALDPSVSDLVKADRVLGGLSPEEMAQLYAETDVLVKLSHIEGLGVPVVEAMHAGVPCVVTPYGGDRDVVAHGGNGLVVGHDDVAAATAALDLLARDRELLERLSAGALESAQGWPDRGASARDFAAALERLDSQPAPGGELPPGLMEAIDLARVATRGGHGAQSEELDRIAAELAVARELVHELSVSRDDCSDMLDEARAELEAIRSTLPYRVARKARAMMSRGTR